jgi:hypothetical protein
MRCCTGRTARPGAARIKGHRSGCWLEIRAEEKAKIVAFDRDFARVRKVSGTVRHAVDECLLFAHSSRSRGLLLASDDAECAAYPTVDKGSGNLGTPPALQRVPHAHGEATAAGETCGDRLVVDRAGSGRPGDQTRAGSRASSPSGEAHQGLATARRRPSAGSVAHTTPGWQPTTVLAACIAPGGLPMSPIS